MLPSPTLLQQLMKIDLLFKFPFRFLYLVIWGYALFSMVFYLFIPLEVRQWSYLISIRIAAFIIPFTVGYLHRKQLFSDRNYLLIMGLFPFALLPFLYTETSWLNQWNPVFYDSMVATWDQYLFGFQPAVMFSEVLSQAWFNELMCLSYIFYYLLSFGLPLMAWRLKPDFYAKTVYFQILGFLIYYFVFLFFPVAGPQFYFPYPENTLASAGIFNAVLQAIHHFGEGPTGAFPSSHVGIALVNLMLIFQISKRFFGWILIPTLMLMASTVYIKAHYAVDVVAGLLSGILIYWLVNLFIKNIIQSDLWLLKLER